MNPAEMVVAIILIVTIGRIIQTRYRHLHGMRDAEAPSPRDDADAVRLRDEMRQLRDRIQVLERVITDTHSSADLDREIERLRDRS